MKHDELILKISLPVDARQPFYWWFPLCSS